MRASLKSALLGAALLTAFGFAAQAQTGATDYSTGVPEQTARLPQASAPLASPTHIMPNADDEAAANRQRELEERDSQDGGDQ